MNVKEAAKLIGKHGIYKHGELCFAIEVLDVRKMFNRMDVEIKPVAGTGKAWISLDNVTFPMQLER